MRSNISLGSAYIDSGRTFPAQKQQKHHFWKGGGGEEREGGVTYRSIVLHTTRGASVFFKCQQTSPDKGIVICSFFFKSTGLLIKCFFYTIGVIC